MKRFDLNGSSAVLIEDGDKATMSVRYKSKVTLGHLYEIDGDVWKVTGSAASKYVDGVLNITLERQ